MLIVDVGVPLQPVSNGKVVDNVAFYINAFCKDIEQIDAELDDLEHFGKNQKSSAQKELNNKNKKVKMTKVTKKRLLQDALCAAVADGRVVSCIVICVSADMI